MSEPVTLSLRVPDIEDVELQTIIMCNALLDRLQDRGTRERVLRYLAERMGELPPRAVRQG